MSSIARTTICIAAFASAACGVTLPQPDEDDARPTEDRAGARESSTNATSPASNGTEGHPGAAGQAVPAGSTRVYRVFVSSELFFSDELHGVAGADAQCAKLADDGLFVPPGRRWIAWLSDETASARQRLGTTPGPWLLPNDALVANDVAHLVGTQTLASAIAMDENGLPELGDVWTGTLASGIRDDKTCDGWATLQGHGRIGSLVATKPEWTSRADIECGGSDWGTSGASPAGSFDKPALHIYCFEVN